MHVHGVQCVARRCSEAHDCSTECCGTAVSLVSKLAVSAERGAPCHGASRAKRRTARHAIAGRGRLLPLLGRASVGARALQDSDSGSSGAPDHEARVAGAGGEALNRDHGARSGASRVPPGGGPAPRRLRRRGNIDRPLNVEPIPQIALGVLLRMCGRANQAWMVSSGRVHSVGARRWRRTRGARADGRARARARCTSAARRATRMSREARGRAGAGAWARVRAARGKSARSCAPRARTGARARGSRRDRLPSVTESSMSSPATRA